MQRYLDLSGVPERRCRAAVAHHGSERPRCGTSVGAATALVTLVDAPPKRQDEIPPCSEDHHEDASCGCGWSDLEDWLHIVAVRSAVDAAIIVGVGYLYSLLFATI